MANVWAIKSGDWSDTTVWNTGALPTSADNVYANGFNVNVNQSITVLTLTNNLLTGSAAAGGTFVFNTPNVIADIVVNILTNVAGQTLLSITATTGLIKLNLPNSIVVMPGGPSPTFIAHSGNCDLEVTAIRLVGGDSTLGAYVIHKTSMGNLIINADLHSGNSNKVGGNTFMQSSNSFTTINGNIKNGTGTGVANAPVRITSGTLTVNGNVLGKDTGTNVNSAIEFTSGNSLNITGTVQGNMSAAIIMSVGTLNITGTIIGGNSGGVSGVVIAGTCILNHIGPAQASIYASAIVCSTPTTATVICTGPFLKQDFIVAIASQTLRINFGSNSYFQFKKSNGDDIDYVSTVEGYNYPLASDVRYGVEYKSGLAIGTCHVPTPDNVRKNIPVDNTVGTSDNVNAEDILEAIQNSTLPIAERLRNVATVESTGAQLEAYQ